MTTYTNEGNGTVLSILNTTQPYIQQNAGEGGAAGLKTIEDVVAVPRTGFATAGNSVRLLRFPTSAKVKRLEIYNDLTGGLIDGGTSSTALVLEVGVVFSNSGEDGTPAGYQNLQPTTVGIGGGTTTQGTNVAIYGTSANFIFGQIVANTTTGATPGALQGPGLFGGEQTFGGVGGTYGSAWTLTEQPLVSIFNFWDAGKNVINDLGYFDLLIGTHTAYNTQPGAGYNIYARMSYAL